MTKQEKTIHEFMTLVRMGELSTEMLRDINGAIVERLKEEHRQGVNHAKQVLNVGMTVRVNHPKLQNRVFTLTEIRRTKATVRPIGEMFSGYNVPLSLVEAV